MTGTGAREKWRRSHCRESTMRLTTGFGYQSADDDDTEDVLPALRDRPGDFFDAFILIGECTTCRVVQEIVNFECA